MAGIAGAIGPGEWKSDSLLARMTNSLRIATTSKSEQWTGTHAGLSRVHSGKDNPAQQPIFNHGGTKCIVMFGECFGYEQLRRELMRCGHEFALPHNDAEFCLQLYEAYGEKAFMRLSGSYCFAIHDIKRRELLLVSDRLGTRPLFYGNTADGKLLFSTQVSSVLSEPSISRELDMAATLEFFTLQRVLGEKTYHRGVRMLTPGSVLHYRAGEVTISPYWYPDYRPEALSLNEYAEELAVTMKLAMKHVNRDSNRVAMLLSGGLDARMAVAAADESLVCYSFGDYENPEVQTARKIADAAGFDFNFLQRDPDHYPNLVDKAVEVGNGMHAFNHAHALGFMENIASDCDVVTHGFAPELLFRGYTLPRVPRELFGLNISKRLDPTLSQDNLPERLFLRGYSLLGKGAGTLFAPDIRESLESRLLETAQALVNEAKPHAGNVYDQFLWPDVYYHARYPSMLFELSLRSFMTERSLVFHNDVIDLHLKLPLSFRVDNRLWLRALERLNGGVARVQDANTGLSPFLPAIVETGIETGKSLMSRLPLLWRLSAPGKPEQNEILKRGLSPKSWPRFERMVRSNPAMRKIIIDTLNDPAALPPDIFDHNHIQTLLTEQLAGKGQHRVILFALLTFGRWHKKYGSA